MKEEEEERERVRGGEGGEREELRSLELQTKYPEQSASKQSVQSLLDLLLSYKTIEINQILLNTGTIFGKILLVLDSVREIHHFAEGKKNHKSIFGR